VSGFQVILLEGSFSADDSDLRVQLDDGSHKSVYEALRPLVGQRVQFALHHLPPHGIEVGKPGAGSCLHPEGVGCPVSHDQYPDRMLTFHLDGVLREDPWSIERFDGSVIPIPFRGLPGHYGRVAAATILDMERMREALSRFSPQALKGLQGSEVEDLLERLRKGAS